jgi:hypothetical protein
MPTPRFQPNDRVYWHRRGYRGRYVCRFLSYSMLTNGTAACTVEVIAHQWNPETSLKGSKRRVALAQLAHADSDAHTAPMAGG